MAVDVVGMGFCALHRTLLERMRDELGEHWFSADGSGEHGVTPRTMPFAAASARWACPSGCTPASTSAT